MDTPVKQVHRRPITQAVKVRESTVDMQALLKAAPALAKETAAKAGQTKNQLRELGASEFGAYSGTEVGAAYKGFRGYTDVKMRLFAKLGVIAITGKADEDGAKLHALFIDAKSGQRLVASHIAKDGTFHVSSRDINVEKYLDR